MKISDIMYLDLETISKMNRAELARSVSALNSAANKRLANLKKANVPSQALYNHGDEKFSVKGLTLNQLRNQYKKVSAFLNSKSSTVKGARQIEKNLEARLGSEYTDLNSEQKRKFWKIYGRLDEINQSVFMDYGTNDAQGYVMDYYRQHKDEDIDSIVNKLNKDFEKIYERQRDMRELET